jgi:hypothetical protein
MNIFSKFLRVILLATFVLPIWVILSLVGFVVAIILHSLFPQPKNSELKCRNNYREIITEFKNHLISIFIYF